jgi:membrane protease YdiL (CAAX protease family)
MINGILMPGPVNAPIDELFRAPGAAWVLFAFGVTVAPFFEEMAFRGFLLPSLCTAFDWVAGQFPSGKPQMFDAAGRPEWGPGASVWTMVIIGIPFLALIPHPAVHLSERILFVLVWASAMALWWGRTLGRNRSVDPPIDGHYHPRWSIPAMGTASVFTSVPFAMLHGAQTSWSLGPFLLLIFVSLVLCWIRLSTRSLAASTMVHALYNFMLFSLMLFHTSGFKHLDRM